MRYPSNHLAVVVVGFLVLVGATVPAQPVLDGAEVVTFREVGGVELRLHGYTPKDWKASDRRPAIVLFFGGGWVGGTPKQFQPHAKYLASRGMVAFCAEYRTKKRGDATPFDCVADGREAVRWVRANANDWGIDPRRIAAGGGSAGGHVAACTGLIPGPDIVVAETPVSARPDAMVLFNPVVDTGPSGYGHERLKEAHRLISPVLLTSPSAPPTLVMHGDADKTVPHGNVVQFRDAMCRADVRCELITYPGRGHGFFNRRPGKTDDYVATTRAMDRFLGSLGWLQGPPTLKHGATALWHGYTRTDATLEGRRVIIVKPDRAAPGNPWIWRARFFGHEPQADVALLEKGFHVVYCDVADLFGNDVALDLWDKTYVLATEKLGLSRKPALECMSRGGLIVFRWAARHPERVACIYADAPVMDIRSWPGGKGKGKGHAATWRRCLKALDLDDASSADWEGDPIDQLAPLAKAGVPLLHIAGDADDVVPIDENTRVAEKRYRELGGSIRVIAKPGVGHHPHSLKDPEPIVRFILRHTVGSGDYFTVRDGLSHSVRKWKERKWGRIAFLGGSITHNPGWRDLVAEDIRRRFPDLKFEFTNVGIPSFGSTPGAFRYARDVNKRGRPDILFVEAAVNDSTNGRSSTEMVRGMEGILRQARLTDPTLDIVVMHFVDPAKMAQINRGVVPEVVKIHERVADHYGAASIDLATEVTERIAAGEFTWKDDFKNLHPSPFGQEIYAASIDRLFEAAWKSPDPDPALRTVPYPLDRHCYQFGKMLHPEHARGGGGWEIVQRWRPTDGAATRRGFVNVPMVILDQPGDSVSVRFDGTAAGIMAVAGPDAGVIESRIDDGPWKRTNLRTRWSGGLHLPWSHVLHGELSNGTHRMDIRLVASNDAATAARIAWFLVNAAPQ